MSKWTADGGNVFYWTRLKSSIMTWNAFEWACRLEGQTVHTSKRGHNEQSDQKTKILHIHFQWEKKETHFHHFLFFHHYYTPIHEWTLGYWQIILKRNDFYNLKILEISIIFQSGIFKCLWRSSISYKVSQVYKTVYNLSCMPVLPHLALPQSHLLLKT